MPMFEDEEALEQELSRPTAAAAAAFERLEGDFLVLGAAGKMGPSFCAMLARLAQAEGASRKVHAVSRFSDPAIRERLQQEGVTTWSGDLADPAFVHGLPDAGTVFHMVGRKFGSQTSQAESWLTNVYLPAVAVSRFLRSRFVLLSSGNIYGLKAVGSAGSTEMEALAPVGEYAQTCVGRERMTEAFADRFGTPVTIIRLNYACELRYGVLVDIARWVHAGQPVPLAMPQLNTIWQRDANELILRAAVDASTPPIVLNLTGPVLQVRETALAFGRHFEREVSFVGEEGAQALLSDASEMLKRFPIELVPAEHMIEWIATWMKSGRPLWNKPTKFEVVDGRF